VRLGGGAVEHLAVTSAPTTPSAVKQVATIFTHWRGCSLVCCWRAGRRRRSQEIREVDLATTRRRWQTTIGVVGHKEKLWAYVSGDTAEGTWIQTYGSSQPHQFLPRRIVGVGRRTGRAGAVRVISTRRCTSRNSPMASRGLTQSLDRSISHRVSVRSAAFPHLNVVAQAPTDRVFAARAL
jgi:hypothetical protein